MKAQQTIQNIEQRIEALKGALAALGAMRPGSLTQQYNVCGKPHCRCKDPENPQRHGPYYQLSYVHRVSGRSKPASKGRNRRVQNQPL